MNTIDPRDIEYFKAFRKDAEAKNISLENHYLEIQVGTSGATEKESAEDDPALMSCVPFLDPSLSYLVLGCGAGAEIGWLKRKGCVNITGLDIAPDLLAHCENRYGIKTILGDMRQTGLKAGAFDVVLTHRSLHHMFYPFAALEEMARISSRHVMILNEPRRLWWKQAARNILGKRIISGAQIYEYQFNTDDVDRYMMFSGFKPANVTCFWESGIRHQNLFKVLSKVVPFLGNRFSAIYERLV